MRCFHPSTQEMTSLGVKWKLYSGISSSEVRNLHAPYVSMTLTTTSKDSGGGEGKGHPEGKGQPEGKGHPETRVLEMRVDQFKVGPYGVLLSR